MKPDASKHNPDPEYLRGLLERAGVTQRAAAQLLGISERMMRYYLIAENKPGHRPAPYPVQFALECLALDGKYTVEVSTTVEYDDLRQLADYLDYAADELQARRITYKSGGIMFLPRHDGGFTMKSDLVMDKSTG